MFTPDRFTTETYGRVVFISTFLSRVRSLLERSDRDTTSEHSVKRF